MPEECRVEMKSDRTHGLLTATEPIGIGQVLEGKNFSSLSRLLAVTAVVLKFCHLLLDRVRTSSTPTKASDDLVQAEILWVIESQQALVKNKNFEQWKRQFDLFQDASMVWRCGGRIQNANVSFSTMHPALLTKDHFLAKLLVLRSHARVQHGGVKSTLTELRSHYWLVRGRSFVRQIIRSCVVCKRFEGKPYRAPLAPPLPHFRVDEAPPFTYTGVDFAGPLYVREAAGCSTKTWICLFTCCVSRAVHIDLVPDLTTPAFIRCMKRFTARRGLPLKMISDNGKTFQAAAKMLEAIFNHHDIQQFAACLGIKWIFNMPKAPWWGGLFERLIRSIKRCLRKVIGQAKLTFDQLLTAVTEVEGVLNSRPLSYVSIDDIQEPLTPSHLLMGRRIMSLPDHLCQEVDEDIEHGPELLTRCVRHLNNTLNQFWLRWRKEYLLELREAHRHQRGHLSPSPIAVDDVVVVHSTDLPRGFWKLGRVKELLAGRDGKIRGATVQVAGKGRQAKTLHRPIQLLYPLEVSRPRSSQPPDDGKPDDGESESLAISTQGTDSLSNDDELDHDPPPRRSSRSAAHAARDRIMAQALEMRNLMRTELFHY